MFNPKQKRAILINVSVFYSDLAYISLSISTLQSSITRTHGREVVKDVPLGLVCEDNVRAHSEHHTRNERDRGADVCYRRKAIKRWRAEAAVNEQALVP
jgi:hypothetical protein